MLAKPGIVQMCLANFSFTLRCGSRESPALQLMAMRIWIANHALRIMAVPLNWFLLRALICSCNMLATSMLCTQTSCQTSWQVVKPPVPCGNWIKAHGINNKGSIQRADSYFEDTSAGREMLLARLDSFVHVCQRLRATHFLPHERHCSHVESASNLCRVRSVHVVESVFNFTAWQQRAAQAKLIQQCCRS